MDQEISNKLLATASLAALLVMAVPSEGREARRLPGMIAPDPQTMASITQGPDMITRAGSSQKAARADLDSNNPALADTVTAKRWQELRNR